MKRYPSVEAVGRAGRVELDAENGQPLVTDELREKILDNVKQLARPAPASVS